MPKNDCHEKCYALYECVYAWKNTQNAWHDRHLINISSNIYAREKKLEGRKYLIVDWERERALNKYQI